MARVQLSRRKGSRRPPDVVNVARPGRWGNPFVIVRTSLGYTVVDSRTTAALEPLPFVRKRTAQAVAVNQHRREFLAGRLDVTPADARAELAGRTLGCWCALDDPCHGDTLADAAEEG